MFLSELLDLSLRHPEVWLFCSLLELDPYRLLALS
jgi:hypothetical protein